MADQTRFYIDQYLCSEQNVQPSSKMEEQLCLSTLDESFLLLQYLMRSRKQIYIFIENNLPELYNRKPVVSLALDKDFDQIVEKVLKSQVNIKSFSVSRISNDKVRQLGKNVLFDILSKYKHLRQLKICHFSIGDYGIRAIQYYGLKLRTISLTENCITAKGAKILARCEFEKFEQLQLNSNQIGNKGLGYLAKAKWSYLQKISLRDCGVTVDGLRLIVKANWPIIHLISIYSRIAIEFKELACFPVNIIAKRFGLLNFEYYRNVLYRNWMKTTKSQQYFRLRNCYFFWSIYQIIQKMKKTLIQMILNKPIQLIIYFITIFNIFKIYLLFFYQKHKRRLIIQNGILHKKIQRNTAISPPGYPNFLENNFMTFTIKHFSRQQIFNFLFIDPFETGN